MEWTHGSSSESTSSRWVSPPFPCFRLWYVHLPLLPSFVVPGGQNANTDKFDGPSGVLVCCEDYIIYKHQGSKEHRVPIPKRSHPLSDPDRGVIITSAVMHKMRVSFNLLSLLPSEENWAKRCGTGCILLLVTKWRRWSLQSNDRSRWRRSSIPQDQILWHCPRRLFTLYPQIRIPLCRIRIR